MSKNSAISHWPDSEAIYRDITELIRLPVYMVKAEAMDKYGKYFKEKCQKSAAHFQSANRYIPGGVQHNLSQNHPFPLSISKTEGAYMWDADGNRYTDLLQAGGATILGNNYRPVIDKVWEAMRPTGPAPGLFTEYEVKLAELICDYMPSIDMVRMLASGTEADIAAVRMARCYTGKKKIIKMGGGYHGWGDQLVYSLHIPGTKRLEAHGIPEECTLHTVEAKTHDLDLMEGLIKQADEEGGVAAVVLEPLGPECATHPVPRNFNEGVRKLCDKYGSLLIFDEVVTGFRTGLGGAQSYFDVAPDITVLGKIVAGGFPAAGAVGGGKEVMSSLAAGVSVGGAPKAYVGGTLTANPISCAGGYYALTAMDETDAAVKAGQAGDKLTEGLQSLIRQYDLPFVAYNHASICHLEASGLMHLDIKAPDFEKQFASRRQAMGMMGLALEAEGVIVLAGSRMYTSLADTQSVIDETLGAFERVFANLEPVQV